jgi:hypothetical protein
MNQRLSAYRRMASARALDEIDQLLAEIQDRYGPMSASVLNLAQHARIRVIADRIGLESLERDGGFVVLKFRPDANVDPTMLLKLMKSRRDLTLLPPAVLKLALQTEPGWRASERRGASWWTARASSQVAPGFNRETILAEAPDDPSAPGGLFERLGELLDQLSQSLVTG